MTTGPTNRVEKVPLRTVWLRERQDFSRWLVENIDFLNEQLPFEVDPESLRPEQAAGDFSVDVVGEATYPDSSEPIMVVIENQLEQTDHDHLGKVLTYLAAFDAKAAVWISGRARPEHAKAVQWLNDESSIDAWLFDVEVIRIAGSPEAPLLTQIVGPSALSRKAKVDKRASEVDRTERGGFWAIVLPRVAEACQHLGVWQGKRVSSSAQVWHRVPNSPGRIGWEIWVSQHRSWICVRVDAESQEEANHYFDQLQSEQETINAEFGSALLWDPLEAYQTSRISWDMPSPVGFRDDSELWPAVGDDLAEAMSRLVAATQYRIAALVPYDVVEIEATVDASTGVVGELEVE
jgi:hypothetical protein